MHSWMWHCVCLMWKTKHTQSLRKTKVRRIWTMTWNQEVLRKQTHAGAPRVQRKHNWSDSAVWVLNMKTFVTQRAHTSHDFQKHEIKPPDRSAVWNVHRLAVSVAKRLGFSNKKRAESVWRWELRRHLQFSVNHSASRAFFSGRIRLTKGQVKVQWK